MSCLKNASDFDFAVLSVFNDVHDVMEEGETSDWLQERKQAEATDAFRFTMFESCAPIGQNHRCDGTVTEDQKHASLSVGMLWSVTDTVPILIHYD